MACCAAFGWAVMSVHLWGVMFGTCARRTHTHLSCMPFNCAQSSVFGELGSGASPGENEDGFESEPVAVAGDHAFASISAGYSHTCGLTLNGSALLCWGESPGNGQRLTPRTLLTEPTEPAWAGDSSLSFVAVSTADDATCALDGDSNIWCFGEAAANET